MTQGFINPLTIPIPINQGGTGTIDGNLSLMNGTSIGTTTNNNAAVGQIGEVISNSGSGVALSTSTPINICSVSLTPGDWDLWANIIYTPTSSTVVSCIVATINTTSATLPSVTNGYSAYTQILYNNGAGGTTGGQHALPAGKIRISIASTTTVYLIGYCNFNTSTLTCNGYIYARRAR